MRILILEAHPDGAEARLNHALAAAYAASAEAAGHSVARLRLAELDIPLLRGEAEFQAPPPPAIAAAQRALAEAEHWAIFYPLWLGDMPALLKAFLEQALRPGFAFGDRSGLGDGGLKGRSARLVVTMGMPALVFRLWYLGASVMAFRRNILHFVGVRPVRSTLVGGTGALSPAAAEAWLGRMRALGAKGL